MPTSPSPPPVFLRRFGIAEGSAVFMVAFLISAVLGILRQMLLNAHFGAGLEAAAYYAAFRLPDTLAVLIAGGALTNALTPVLLATARQCGEEAVRRLVNLITTTLMVVIVPVVVAFGLLTPWFVQVILAPGFDAATQQLTTALTRIMLLELLLVVLISVASTVLISRGQFLLPAIAVAVHNTTLISGIVAAMLFPAIGIYGPTVGAVGDGLLELAILLPGLRRQGLHYRPIWCPTDPQLRETIALLLPSGLSASVNYAGGIVDTAFASMVREAGAIPALQNALMLIGLPIRLLGLSIAQSALPRLAGLAAAEEWHQMRATLLRVLATMGGLAMLAALAMALLGRYAIRLVFEYGRFDAAAGQLTYELMLAFVVALPTYIGSELLTRGLVALRDTRTPLLINCLQLAGRIALIPLLLPIYGARAIPLAFAITSLAEALLLGSVLLARLRFLARAARKE